MFSANENIVLRREKRRVVGYVEEMLTEEALDKGTSVMAMQVSCRDPGCVPLETVIIIVFPNFAEEIVPGLPESKNGGSYKTKILMPLAQVTKEDVCQALPPSFIGGKRTLETMGYQLRDSLLAQLHQLLTSNTEKTLLAQYLQSSLTDYIQNDCIPPPLQQPYPTTPTAATDTQTDDEPSNTNNTTATNATTSQNNNRVVKGNMNGSGNFIIRRRPPTTTTTNNDAGDNVSHENNRSKTSIPSYTNQTAPKTTIVPIQIPITNTTTTTAAASSDQLLQLLRQQHAPGVRRAGCPCCDPDHPSNIAESLLLM